MLPRKYSYYKEDYTSSRSIFIFLRLLPPSDAIRKQKKNISEDLFSSVLLHFKKYHPLVT